MLIETYGRDYNMITYDKANELLTGRCKDSRKVANNTYLLRRDNDIAVRLRNTDVVTIKADNTFILNSGGWLTLTTKDRINCYSPASISQRKGIWYLDNRYLYQDNMAVNMEGMPLDPVSDIEVKKTEKLKGKLDRMVSKYIKDFIKHIKTNGLEDPSNGDCFGCTMEDNEGNNDIITGVVHYFDHFREGYFVSSMLFKAIVDRGYADPGLIWHMIKTDIEKGDNDLWQVSTALRNYFKSRKPKMLEYLKECEVTI